MRERWRPWARRSAVIVTAGLVALALSSDQLSAQITKPNPTTALPGIDVKPDESSPQLLASPKGAVLRVWQRSADRQAGGGGVFVAAAEPPDGWRKLLDIAPTEPGVRVLEAHMAISASDEIALVYRWWRDEPRSKQIRLARSDDGGKTWNQSSTPVDTSGKSFYPRVAWGRDRSLVVTWNDERRGGRSFDVYARRSHDGGVTWEPEQLLSRFPSSSSTDLYARPEMVSDGKDTFWAVWVGIRRGRDGLYLSRSTDGGKTWADPVALSGDSQSVFRHTLSRVGDRLLLAWQDVRTGKNRIYAVSSADAGGTWTSPVRVDHMPAESTSDATAPAVSMGENGEVWAAWQDGRNGRDDIFVSHSTDWGKSWGNEDERMDLDEPGTGFSRYPRFAKASDGRIAIAWEDDRAGLEAIYVRVKEAGERAAWGREVIASSPAVKRGARIPQLTWGPNGHLYLAWEIWDYTLAPARTMKQVDGRVLRLDKP